jgi:hypothetical protein
MLLILFFIFVVGVRPQEVGKSDEVVLTNNDVVQMVKSGFSDELILAKIKTSKTKFETSPSVLTDLKQSGVSDKILVAMVESHSPSTVTTPALQPDANLETARSALKSLRRLTTATEVGISYVNYSPLVAEVKAEVDDALSRMRDGNLKTSIQSSLNEYAYAAAVWQATWRGDFVDGQLKDVAVNKYGVKKKGWLKVVWREDFLNAIWREARNQFEVANGVLSQGQIASLSNSQGVQDDLVGAWRVTFNATNGQNFQCDLTITKSGDGYRGTLRTLMGNADNVTITKDGIRFTLYAVEQQKKDAFSIRMEGTIESNFIKGNAALSVGKQSGNVVFVGTRLVN